MKRLFLIIILLFAVVNSYCPNVKKEIYAPAVVNENLSQMIKIKIEIKPTNEVGEVYYNLQPLIGIEAQKSILIANSVARKIANSNGIDVSDCDVFIEISNERGVEYIEGPSAGALFTILMLSGFENKELKTDITMTGSIDSNANIGSVGGLPLKAEAAYKLGFKKIVFPMMSNSEKVEILMLKRYYNITILQAKNISEAYLFFTSDKKFLENLSLSAEPMQKFEKINVNHKYENWIKRVTEKMINDAENELDKTQIEYRQNFESRLINSKNAFESNQYYTAANIAFLLSIDKEVSLFGKEKMINEYTETKKCLDQFERKINEAKKKMNDKNFEIIGASQARYYWASIKLNEAISEEEIFRMTTDNQKSEFISPLLNKYKDIINAKYWCLAANHMLDELKDEDDYEKQFLDYKLKKYVEDVLNNLTVDEENVDAVFRMKSAEVAFKNGDYLSSLVDAAYIKSYSQLEQLASSNASDEKINEIIDKLVNKNYNYIWPIILRNHAKEISKTEKISALRVALIADNLENYYREAEMINKETAYLIDNISSENRSEINQLSIILFVAVTIFVVFIILLSKIKNNKKIRSRKIRK